MISRITEIAKRFLAEEKCTQQELKEFKKWLSDPLTQHEVEGWVSEYWVTSPEMDSTSLIETVYHQILDRQRYHLPKPTFSFTRILKAYQKVAAILLIPVIGLGLWYFVSQSSQSTEQFAEAIAPRGQKSQVVLPDGTRVWLNSATSIKYPTNFNNHQRDVYLEGEAFFEVRRNVLKPFVVHTTGLSVKVLGTKFNVKAYHDEDRIETALFEGKIDLLINTLSSSRPIVKEVNPGQSFSYSKTEEKLIPSRFPREEIDGWKKNQLIFKDDTFSNLVKKLERWYDVEVVYDEKLFNDRHLTVELYEGERLDMLMKVIGLALSVNYQYEKGKIILTPKDKKS